MRQFIAFVIVSARPILNVAKINTQNNAPVGWRPLRAGTVIKTWNQKYG